MVNFENEATIGTPAVDIVRVLILQRRNDVLEAKEKLLSKEGQGFEVSTHIFRARLNTLFDEVEGALYRRYFNKQDIIHKGVISEKTTYEWIVNKLRSKKISDNEEAFYFLNRWLDAIHLTRIDSRDNYDTTDIEMENKTKRV